MTKLMIASCIMASNEDDLKKGDNIKNEDDRIFVAPLPLKKFSP